MDPTLCTAWRRVTHPCRIPWVQYQTACFPQKDKLRLVMGGPAIFFNFCFYWQTRRRPTSVSVHSGRSEAFVFGSRIKSATKKNTKNSSWDEKTCGERSMTEDSSRLCSTCFCWHVIGTVCVSKVTELSSVEGRGEGSGCIFVKITKKRQHFVEGWLAGSPTERKMRHKALFRCSSF